MISYTWIPYFTGVVAFFMAYGIGANDVANAFATSVGAKALTLKQALWIAAVMEFSGAFLMGSHVTQTVAKGIIDPSLFLDKPEILMIANMCALLAAAIWLIIATNYNMPVSTTHSIIGALVGCGLVAASADAIKWSEIIKIVISWFTSPVLSGMFSFVLFYLVRTFILRKKNSFNRALNFFPWLVGLTFVVNVFFVIYKGSPQLKLENTPFWLSLLISASIGAIVGVIVYFVAVPRLRSRSMKVEDSVPAPAPAEASATAEAEAAAPTEQETSVEITVEKKQEHHFLERDVHAELKDEESQVYKIHQHAEKFDPKTEKVFSFVQVVTATFDSFCHGSNDVAKPLVLLLVLFPFILTRVFLKSPKCLFGFLL